MVDTKQREDQYSRKAKSKESQNYPAKEQEESHNADSVVWVFSSNSVIVKKDSINIEE